MTPHAALRHLLLLPLICGCAPRPKAVTVPPELQEMAQWLHAHPTAGGVLTLSATGAATVAQAGHKPFQEAAAQVALLAHDVTPLQQLMAQSHLDYLLTTEPDFHDLPDVRNDKAILAPSVLQHLVTLYGTGTRDRACVDGLQLVAAASTIRNVGGRHLPAALLFKRVPGALLQLHKLVPGIPVRVETRRKFAGQVFMFDCQTRANGTGDLTMRFPYATLPESPVLMWMATSKGGEPIQVSADAVEKGLTVDLTQ